jgi:predicted HicB family RNase H-like nuclease
MPARFNLLSVCYHSAVESNGNAESQEGAKAVLMLRIVPALKTRLAAYARERGLTLNAAATVLLDRALRETKD